MRHQIKRFAIHTSSMGTHTINIEYIPGAGDKPGSDGKTFIETRLDEEVQWLLRNRRGDDSPIVIDLSDGEVCNYFFLKTTGNTAAMNGEVFH